MRITPGTGTSFYDRWCFNHSKAINRTVLHNGIHFPKSYSARRDVFTRASPFRAFSDSHPIGKDDQSLMKGKEPGAPADPMCETMAGNSKIQGQKRRSHECN